MKIREANINDINQIASLMLQVAEIHFDARKDIFKEKSIEQIKSELKERFENNESILVIEENNEIIGVLIYKIKEIKKHINLKDRNVLWIDELVVAEKNRGNGTGKVLFKEVMKIAKIKKCNFVELNCWNFNKDAIKFYEKCEMKIQRNIMEIKVDI